MKIIERLKMVDVVESGHMMRPVHGIAYHDYEMDRRVTAVVPLNWVMAISLATWSFLRFGSRWIADSPRAAYRQGLKEGLRKRKASAIDGVHHD